MKTLLILTASVCLIAMYYQLVPLHRSRSRNLMSSVNYYFPSATIGIPVPS